MIELITVLALLAATVFFASIVFSGVYVIGATLMPPSIKVITTPTLSSCGGCTMKKMQAHTS